MLGQEAHSVKPFGGPFAQEILRAKLKDGSRKRVGLLFWCHRETGAILDI